MEGVPLESVDKIWFPGSRCNANSYSYFETNVLKEVMGKKQQCAPDAKSTLTLSVAKKNLVRRVNSYTLQLQNSLLPRLREGRNDP